MTASARMYQVLYIIRQLTQRGTRYPTLTGIQDFIQERRASVRGVYERAYISPSALVDLLRRMYAADLVTALNELTQRGEAIAKLLDNIDACSDLFQDNYKSHVVKAVLLRHGLSTQRSIASLSGMSMDSVRRGLEALGDEVVTTSQGRESGYAILIPKVILPIDRMDDPEPESKKEDLLEGFVDGDLEYTPPAPPPDDEDAVSLAAILKDDVPDEKKGWGTFESPMPEDFDLDDEDEFCQNASLWAEVPESIQEDYLALARLTGKSLSDLMSTMIHQIRDRILAALLAL